MLVKKCFSSYVYVQINLINLNIDIGTSRPVVSADFNTNEHLSAQEFDSSIKYNLVLNCLFLGRQM